MDLNGTYEVNSPSTIADEVAGETLAINLTTGTYLVLGPGCAPVWRALCDGVEPADLLDGPQDPRAETLRAFLGRLLDAGLLRPAARPAGVAPAVQWAAEDLVWQEHSDLAELLVMDLIHDADENVGWPMRRPE